MTTKVCLTGAIKYCASQMGDAYLICAVLRKCGRGENWNDSADTKISDVISYLQTDDITDADLKKTFGTQWEQIVAFVRHAATLTVDVGRQLVAAWEAARESAWGAAEALAVRHLINENTAWNQAAYDLLTGPWRTVIGPIHPDDAPMGGAE